MRTSTLPCTTVTTQTPPSAWSRLVQRTQSAASSHTATLVAPAPSTRNEALPSGKPSTMMEVARRRRSTVRDTSAVAPPNPAPKISKRKSPPASRTSTEIPRIQHDAAPKARPTMKECIEVCPCLEGDEPLGGGKCSLWTVSERKDAAVRVGAASRRIVDLRSFWAANVELKDATETKQETVDGYGGNEESASGMDADDGEAEMNALTSRMKHFRRGQIENDTSHQIALSSPDIAKSSTTQLGMLDFQPADTPACASTTPRESTSPAQSAERTRQHVRQPVLHSISNPLDALRYLAHGQEAGGVDGKAVLTRERMAITEVEADECQSSPSNYSDVRIHTDAESEEPHTNSAISTPTRTPALRGSNHNMLNRAPLPAPPSDASPSEPLPTGIFSPSPPSENERRARKPKRRLTLHGTAPQKKRKTSSSGPPTKKKQQIVQTTLALAVGGNAGMRECKLCDTVYNPLHAEDVKVHAKRHAGVLKRWGEAGEV